jgi:hypothetical protein
MPPIDEDDLPPVPKEKLSKAPSWIMVGFVIGCLFAYVADRELAKRRPKAAAEPAAPSRTVTPPPVVQTPPSLLLSQNEIDALFATIADRAVWENDLTQIALWNPRTSKFSDLVEVMRSGDYYYYRPLAKLTRPLISAETEAGGPPVLFTEPESVREARLKSIPAFLRPAVPKLP